MENATQNRETEALKGAIRKVLTKTNPTLTDAQLDKAVKRLERMNTVNYLLGSIKGPNPLQQLEDKLKKPHVQEIVSGLSPDPARLATKFANGVVLRLKGGDVDKEILATPRQKKVARIAGALAIPAAKTAGVAVLAALTRFSPIGIAAIGMGRTGLAINSAIQDKRLADPSKKLPQLMKEVVKEGVVTNAIVTGLATATGIGLLKSGFMMATAGLGMIAATDFNGVKKLRDMGQIVKNGISKDALKGANYKTIFTQLKDAAVDFAANQADIDLNLDMDRLEQANKPTVAENKPKAQSQRPNPMMRRAPGMSMGMGGM